MRTQSPYRSGRVEGSVKYSIASKGSWLMTLVTGVLSGAGLIGLAFALGWTEAYLGFVIAGAAGLAFIIAISSSLFHRDQVLSGTMIVDGTSIQGPGERHRFDLGKAYEAEITGDPESCCVVLSRQTHAVPLVRRIDGQIERFDATTSLLLKNVSADRMQKVFGIRAYVNTQFHVPSGELELDAHDPTQTQLVEAFIATLERNRAHNIRYQAFASLPWDQASAPTSPPLRDVDIDVGSNPKAAFAALTTPFEDLDPAKPEQIIARAYQDVRLWLDSDNPLGVTPHYVLVTGVRKFSLIPIGSGRANAGRDIFRIPTGRGNTSSRGSRERAALVIAVHGSPEPLWVVFSDFLDETNHQLDAVVAFINRE